MTAEKTIIILTQKEATAILSWLEEHRNRKWVGGSRMDIKEVYDRLAEFANRKSRWKWKVLK